MLIWNIEELTKAFTPIPTLQDISTETSIFIDTKYEKTKMTSIQIYMIISFTLNLLAKYQNQIGTMINFHRISDLHWLS